MKYIGMGIGLAILLLWFSLGRILGILGAVEAQAHDPAGTTTTACCTLSHEQQLELQVRQKDAMLAQRDVTAAQAVFNQRLAELNQEAEAIRKANGWPATVQFDPNTVTFTNKPAAASAPTKK